MKGPPLPAEIIAILSAFAPVMRVTTWLKAEILLIGAFLCQGPRRISSILRVLGKSNERRFEKYHRVLNRDKGSCALCAKILLGLWVALLPADFPIIIAVDETLERRKGKMIKAKGCYRDAVRSTERRVVKCFGLKWICMALIIPLPWNERPWALPFLTVLAPSKAANERRNREQRTVVDWTVVMLRLVSRWLRKSWILVGDGAYACIELGHHCRKHGVTLISILRRDVNLYEFPEPPRPGKRGRKSTKGKPIAKLKDMAKDAGQNWTESGITGYGGKKKSIKYLTGVNLWYKAGEVPLPVRWVLVIDPDNPERPEAFFSTDTEMSPEQIVEHFVLRWNIEVTFEKSRAHMGIETQRQWSDKAIGRTTPVLMGLYSLACVIAKEMSQTMKLNAEVTAWYNKEGQATFSDVIAFVRRSIWAAKFFLNSKSTDKSIKLPRQELDFLINQLVMAA
ncbi:hypothetical protein E3U44_11405 [Nitrosococcus wardiae]|uniref:Transposase IS701-like DDE domain-containing protein n=1 Tax=Nitrosococcus wardiae TaxID=1814290 RepID=A0A4P7BYB7_9GAMM|nr:hypothetical protein E3U44_11405 [Nitrosococcus wardiae]